MVRSIVLENPDRKYLRKGRPAINTVDNQAFQSRYVIPNKILYFPADIPYTTIKVPFLTFLYIVSIYE